MLMLGGYHSLALLQTTSTRFSQMTRTFTFCQRGIELISSPTLTSLASTYSTRSSTNRAFARDMSICGAIRNPRISLGSLWSMSFSLTDANSAPLRKACRTRRLLLFVEQKEYFCPVYSRMLDLTWLRPYCCYAITCKALWSSTSAGTSSVLQSGAPLLSVYT